MKLKNFVHTRYFSSPHQDYTYRPDAKTDRRRWPNNSRAEGGSRVNTQIRDNGMARGIIAVALPEDIYGGGEK